MAAQGAIAAVNSHKVPKAGTVVDDLPDANLLGMAKISGKGSGISHRSARCGGHSGRGPYDVTGVDCTGTPSQPMLAQGILVLTERTTYR